MRTYDGSMRGLRGALVAGAMAVMVWCAPFAHADEVSPASDAEITVTDDGIELIPATSQEEVVATTVTDDGIELIPATSRTEEAPTGSVTAAGSAESAATSVGSAVSLATSAAPASTTAIATTSSPVAGALTSSGESSDDGGIEVLGVSSEIAAGASGDSNGSNVATIIWIAAGILVAVGAGALLFRFRNAAGR